MTAETHAQFRWPAETRSFCAELPFTPRTTIFEYGKGIQLFDARGRGYIDALSGVFVTCFGYDCEPIIAAMTEQLRRGLTFQPPLHGTNQNALRLAHALTGIAPEGITAVKLLSGGSEAIEAAIRLSRVYHAITGNPGKQKVISHYTSYHGATYGSLGLTGVSGVKVFGAPMPGVVHTLSPEAMQREWGLTAEEAADRAAALIEQTIELEGPEQVAALFVETVSQLRELQSPHPSYFTKLREICDRHGVLLVFDEIVTGFGRSGQNFGVDTVGVIPDMICAGKGLSGGYAPLSALLINERVAGPFRDGDGHMAFGTTHTFSGNPIATAAGLAAVTHFTEGDFLPRIQELSVQFRQGLADAIGDRATVNLVGLLCGVSVPDPDNRGIGDLVEAACWERGVIVRGMPYGIMVAPPFVTTPAQLDEICSVVGEAIAQVS
ncbi:aspartate aminotransferase family protein [Kibdelosporangium phytohabitans]|uniref:Acetylornithine aminotransferase n=1 Tax=Kibdelosporangium phytohabitans TaxID=860235 RepID=A0A0N9I3W0_9PSEU|nr:aminotransferase class III-fold pyridoxal phosphate-dependent enzyme [Kibdelosporangium phytohabitans]ALG10749.1 acetylornithine aminotransferase [Kibdelosporangium phytohabitans]MBE1461899.1 adenosylmethionine-8-amino-7-oxononanoate aminotransferase [Kibdelosporangium phytohabitans]